MKKPTSFAVKQDVYTNEVGESAWWLRSLVENKTQTSYISSGGSFGNRPHYVDENIIGVRLAVTSKSYGSDVLIRFICSFHCVVLMF